MQVTGLFIGINVELLHGHGHERISDILERNKLHGNHKD